MAATLVACLVGTWLAALAPLPALAHEGDSDQASVLVLQAIGIGVDLAQVQAAKDALDTGDMGQARTLLQQSLQGGAPMEAASGEETGTTVVHDSLNPRGHLAGGDWVLLAISVLALALGGWLAVRYRPHESVRVLRRQLAAPPSDPTPSSSGGGADD